MRTWNEMTEAAPSTPASQAQVHLGHRDTWTSIFVLVLSIEIVRYTYGDKSAS